MPKNEWTCRIDGRNFKIIQKRSRHDRLLWTKVKPLSDGTTLGIMVVGDLSNPKNVHYDFYHNQQNHFLPPTNVSNFNYGSVYVGSPTQTAINTSGAVKTEIIPMSANITEIETESHDGSISLTANATGYIYYVNIFSQK